MDEDILIRPLAEGDWDAIVELEAGAYGEDGLSEGRDALRARWRSSPGTCFVVECGGRFGGYLLALPYPLFQCPDLSRAEERSFDSGNLHAHDLVIADGLRGRGLAARLLSHLADLAREQRFERISMVAVRGAHVLWARLGYREHPEVALPAGYGAQAVYMSMALQTA